MQPTSEQQMIIDSARNFARKRLAPNSAQWEREGAFPVSYTHLTLPTNREV